MTRVYYKEAVGAFIVFDVTRMDTFKAIDKWKAEAICQIASCVEDGAAGANRTGAAAPVGEKAARRRRGGGEVGRRRRHRQQGGGMDGSGDGDALRARLDRSRITNSATESATALSRSVPAPGLSE